LGVKEAETTKLDPHYERQPIRLKDKIALVTDSSRGVGRAVALGFA